MIKGTLERVEKTINSLTCRSNMLVFFNDGSVRSKACLNRRFLCPFAGGNFFMSVVWRCRPILVAAFCCNPRRRRFWEMGECIIPSPCNYEWWWWSSSWSWWSWWSGWSWCFLFQSPSSVEKWECTLSARCRFLSTAVCTLTPPPDRQTQLNRSSARWVTWQKGGGEEQGEGLGFNTKKTRKAKLDENFFFVV